MLKALNQLLDFHNFRLNLVAGVTPSIVARIQYKKDLIKTVNSFKKDPVMFWHLVCQPLIGSDDQTVHVVATPKDVVRFRAEYERSGPMVKGIPPREAVERLKRTLATESPACDARINARKSTKLGKYS